MKPPEDIERALKAYSHVRDGVPLFVVYNRPKDYPASCVARLWNMDKPTDVVLVRDTLEELQQIMLA